MLYASLNSRYTYFLVLNSQLGWKEWESKDFYPFFVFFRGIGLFECWKEKRRVGWTKKGKRRRDGENDLFDHFMILSFWFWAPFLILFPKQARVCKRVFCYYKQKMMTASSWGINLFFTIKYFLPLFSC